MAVVSATFVWVSLWAGGLHAQPADGLLIDPARAQHRFLGRDDVQTTLLLRNRLAVQQHKEIRAEVLDQASGRVVMRVQQKLSLLPGQDTPLELTLPARPGIELRLRWGDVSAEKSADGSVDGSAAGSADKSADVSANSSSGAAAPTPSHSKPEVTLVVPYLLTPPDAETPALHGARLFGAHPGTPLQHRVPASGRAPLRFEAPGLPPGLLLDSSTGIISGTVPAAGRHTVRITVSNALGSAARDWTLVAGDQLVLTPPMGWASWHAHGLHVSASLVRAAAQALLDQGLAAKGWNVVQVDDGWQASQRGADGALAGHAGFPDMAGLARHLHQSGLQFGLYASPGATSCGQLPGTWGFEAQDAATWAAWGVDHIKYDLCSATEQLPARPTLQDHQQPYRLMGGLLRQQPRSLAFHLLQYGQHRVWAWGAEVGGHSWRMTGDIQDSWPDLLATGFAMAPYAGFVGPGRFNDPDTLMVGLLGPAGDSGEPRPTRLTPDEQYTQVSLWSLLAAPLMLGNHLAALDEFTLNLLGNSEVIAINQDALARSAVRVLDRNGWQVWVKELEGGAKAVGVFNMGASFGRFELEPALFGRGAEPYQPRDTWRQRDLPLRNGTTVLAVPAHGVALLTVR